MRRITAYTTCVASLWFFITAGTGWGTTNEGFTDHGVSAPFSTHRGIVATTDESGRRLILAWLYDHRGCYALLVVDIDHRQSQQVATPFPWGGDGPYASLLSGRGKLYSHFGSHFVEFDPTTRTFTFVHKTVPQMAMSLTEDDKGRIWSVSYPQCGLASFDPATREFRDYGHLHRENWAQYPRSIACDDTGWVYFAIGFTRSHILAFDPTAGEIHPMLGPEERKQGMAEVFRGTDGKVYGRPSQEADAPWYRFYQGQPEKLAALPPNVQRQEQITGSQGLFHRRFPDGSEIRTFDLESKQAVVYDRPKGTTLTVPFEYTSQGAHVMAVAVAPNGVVCGGTAFPFYFFAYDPRLDRWERHPCYGQWNTLARQGDRLFVGGYGQGFLLEWDPARPWRETVPGNPASNPRYLANAYPHINRPHELLAHPNGTTLVLAGTPAYGHTGGGLLIWDLKSASSTLLKHTDILPEHSTTSLVALNDSWLLGGTTVAPGTGGEQIATCAELYLFDLRTNRLEWHAPVLKSVREYTDLYYDIRLRQVYGIADRTRLFSFDPQAKKVVFEMELRPKFGATVSHQGPRVFISDQRGRIFVLLARGIALFRPEVPQLEWLAHSPVTITAGGDIHEGRIYFASGSHLWSFDVDKSIQVSHEHPSGVDTP